MNAADGEAIVAVQPMEEKRREGQTVAGRSRLAAYVNFVKLPHTIFALPFELVGVVLASYTARVTVGAVLWVAVAFTGARFAAMGFNRIIDRDIDARNPRTNMRELPRGVMNVREAWIAVVVASAVFVVAAWQLNPLCGWLSPLALGWVFFYSFTKRFTRWSHVVLGAGLAIAPVGGYLAIRGEWSSPWWMLIALALAVTTWSAGFDVLYALQDAEFDRSEGLHSLPAMLGDERALDVARTLHMIAVVSLVAVGAAMFGTTRYGTYYALGAVFVAVLLMYEHSLVTPGDLSRLDAAFFTMNGVISIGFFLFVLAERIVHDPRSLYPVPLPIPLP
jgi:4-hydroxybenzoate polyprenyltransferase